ncbi:tRNA uridine(34) 5-carboxymethylaminomethyl modification radical SAM/GNAT enzyme Elp3 [Candidatus Pacearchaeota archaeon]|nr:tRNA uridine(34) 5-carboxymethylaminomethyl modification radical SAM/GNAT enzyme Elp3 [Candidatus Pacearchaeota archaeon]
MKKPMRTISGITPVAVMLPPRKCEHGNCIYCPSLNVPQSYTPRSPVVMRAMRVNYDAYKQIKERLKVFEAMGHATDKIELIIMGGTFLEYPKKFQYEFVKSCYDGLNEEKSQRDDSGGPSKNLEEAKKRNEEAKHRCVALCIETRPDVCSKFINRMRKWGVTRVELGVQIIDDKIYKKVKRGHTVHDVVEATRDLKDAGFKVGYHIMPGLPGSDLKKDIELFKKLFSDERFKPDQLKLYPCQVMPGSELEDLYWKKKFKPYTKEETEKILIEMMKAVPRYCRVMRVMREIPPEYIVAGTIKIDLRKSIEEEFRKNNVKLKEIRYREIGFALRDSKEVNLNLKLKVSKYKASEGEEYFLEIVNKDNILFGLLRLRILSPKGVPSVRGDINTEGIGIVRELHVYGQSLKLGEKIETTTPKGVPREHVLNSMLYKGQHRGFGKWLMKEAEEICLREKIKKLKVISGVGVREYYKKLGYVLEDEYMVKKL